MTIPCASKQIIQVSLYFLRFSLLIFISLFSKFAAAQICSGAADMWFANDESGSVDATEFTQALDFLYQVSDEFVYDDGTGARGSVFGWSANGQINFYISPASTDFGDEDDTGLFDPNYDGDDSDNSIALDLDGTGIRELYGARTFNNGTWLAQATNQLTITIGDNTDTNADGITDNGRRNNVPQIAVFLTDAFDTQLITAGTGGQSGQLGGSDWDAALASLQAAGPLGTNTVIMLIDEAADAYGVPGDGNEGTAGNAAARALIDGFVDDYGVGLFVGDTYAQIADPVNNYISGLVDLICDFTGLVVEIIDQPTSYSDNTTFTVTIQFTEDVINFDTSDLIIANATASNLIQISGAEFTVDITPNGSNGTITVDIPLGAAQTTGGKNSLPAQQGVTEFDSDGDGIGDGTEGLTTDSDGDGVLDFQDLDSDNDGIPDEIEAADNSAFVVAPTISLPAQSQAPVLRMPFGFGSPRDTDGDGIPDFRDLDSDNDGRLDIRESRSPVARGLVNRRAGRMRPPVAFGLDGLADLLQSGGDGGALNYSVADTDGDSIPDFRDRDTDSDSLSDLFECGLPFANIRMLDSDDDGDIDLPDQTPANTVGADGIVDLIQGGADDQDLDYDAPDTDGDELDDAEDLDTDSDGIPDLTEGGNSSAEAADTNSNGFIEPGEDDVSDDGISDSAQGGSDGGALPEPTNSDAGSEIGDEIPDFRDLDADNDGLLDVVEAPATDINNDGLADGEDLDVNGMIDTGFVTDPVDTDPTDAPDYQTVDSNGANPGDDNDSDPIADGEDTSPDDGILDDPTDSDGDGIADVVDDKDGPGVLADADIIITETDGDTEVAELSPGDTDTVDIVLTRPPENDVVITIEIDDATEAEVTPTELTFTDSDWDNPQTITITGMDDDLVDGDQTIDLDITVDDANSDDAFDGLSDSIDITVTDQTPDTDGDGISDVQEGTGDSDGDGIIDAEDSDSDNDGIPDDQELGDDPENLADSDNDGTPDYIELDADNDGILDVIEVGDNPADPTDTDNDGTPDYQDTDSDNDGLPDAIEDTNTPPLADQDVVGDGPDTGGNGIDDAIDVLVTGGDDDNGNGIDDALEPSDTDNDSNPDHTDLDSDGDGLLDIIEADVPSPVGTDTDSDGIDDSLDVDQTGGMDANGNGLDDALEPNDSDQDGSPDYLDLDSDNDSLPDSVEAFETPPTYTGLDTDSDGIDDGIDADNGGDPTDVNGNGVSDTADSRDNDGDGSANAQDLDSDNDSLTDIEEAITEDDNNDALVDSPEDEASVAIPEDTDSDGIPNFIDTESTNTANDGSGDLDIDTNPGLPPGADGDNDGILDDPTDSDGDGIADVADLDPSGFGSGNDTDGDGIADESDIDSDNDSIPDDTEGADFDDPSNSNDTDGDGVPDFQDLDSDNDGISDVIESGSGASDEDLNGRLDDFIDEDPQDGLDDSLDENLQPVDSDADGTPDFQDPDSDNDGVNDLEEGGAGSVGADSGSNGSELDGNQDGQIDNTDPDTGVGVDEDNNLVLVTPPDTDSDGLPNQLDNDSDNDGFDDGIENVDSDNDGQPDRLVDGDDELETSVSGAGASDGLFGLIIAFALLWVRNPARIRLVLATVLLCCAPWVSAEQGCSHIKTEFERCWYLGYGLGVSHVDPEGESNGWRTGEDKSAGWELTLGYHFREHWFAELKYADMGKAGLRNDNAAVNELFPDAAIYYQVPSVMAGYYLRDRSKRINPYVKVGIAGILNGTEKSGGTVDFDEVTAAQLALGIGADLWVDNTPMSIRINFDSYDRDAWFFSIGGVYRFE